MSLLHLLRKVEYEMTALRRENEVLRAKSQVVDAFAAALSTPAPQQGYAEDMVWRLQGAIRDLEAEADAPAPVEE